MKKDIAPIRWIVCVIAVALLAACGDSDQTAQTQVVRKKLVAQTQPGPKAATAPIAKVEPAEVVQAPAPEPSPPPAPKEPPPPTQAPPPPSVQPAVAVQVPVGVVARVSTTPESLPPPLPEVRIPGTTTIASERPAGALLDVQIPQPYAGKGKVNPFEPLLREDAAQGAAAKLTAKKRTPQSPLEKIDLGQLKLVAIIAASTGNRALVEEGSGKGYILKEGTYVGLNSGKVVDIALDKILVEEEFEDVYGKTVLQKKEITLPKPPGEL
jgi:type IV pilus assembly protein PilP